MSLVSRPVPPFYTGYVVKLALLYFSGTENVG